MIPIQEGDIVNVFYCNKEEGHLLDVKVLHVPCNTGDMWYFETKDGDVYGQNPTSANFDNILRKKKDNIKQ